MSTISITKLYDLLAVKLGKETAENLTTFIDNKLNDGLESNIKHLATKEDLAAKHAESIKWMFIFWIGQVIATFGLILLFLKK